MIGITSAKSAKQISISAVSGASPMSQFPLKT